MPQTGTFNQNIKFSGKIGGYRRVFEGHTPLLIGGFNWDLKDLPTHGNVLPAGTPILVDEEKRTIKPLYGFKVVKNETTKLSVEKIFAGTRAKVGMTIGGQKVTEIDASNDAYDVLTMASAVTADVGSVVYGTVDGVDIKDKVNGLTPYDICLEPNAFSADGDVAWNMMDAPILERRMPPITDEVKKALITNGCFFRFSNRH